MAVHRENFQIRKVKSVVKSKEMLQVFLYISCFLPLFYCNIGFFSAQKGIKRK